MWEAIVAFGKKRTAAQTTTAAVAPPPAAPSILDQYVRSSPSAQNAVDIFAGEWSSGLPAAAGAVAGQVPLFDDPRIHWVIETVGGIKDFRVLELGPLEAGHTYMLHQAGAHVVAIESNTRAYLKCLVVKELLAMNGCQFLLGDFAPYLETSTEHFDLLLASGVLYHSPDPIGLLESIARVSDRVGIWTQYYEPNVVAADPTKSRMFVVDPEVVEWRGHTLTMHRRDYLESLQWGGFCGGPETSALWMERDDLLTVLNELGFTDIQIQSDDLTHQNGAAIMLCASRPS
jgi:SAM-dependent methyltransferase